MKEKTLSIQPVAMMGQFWEIWDEFIENSDQAIAIGIPIHGKHNVEVLFSLQPKVLVIGIEFVKHGKQEVQQMKLLLSEDTKEVVMYFNFNSSSWKLMMSNLISLEGQSEMAKITLNDISNYLFEK